jgi:DNA-binding NarL/FixJ family response regulator
MGIDLLLADADRRAIRRAGELLALHPRLRIVGRARSDAETIRLTEAGRPDVVVSEIRQPRVDGLRAIRRLRDAGVRARFVIRTRERDPACVRAALAAGAWGYVAKDDPLESLLEAIDRAMRQECYLSPSVAGAIADRAARQRIHHLLPSLFSQAELRIFAQLERGIAVASVARALRCSQSRVLAVHRRVRRRCEDLGLRGGDAGDAHPAAAARRGAQALLHGLVRRRSMRAPAAGAAMGRMADSARLGTD